MYTGDVYRNMEVVIQHGPLKPNQGMVKSTRKANGRTIVDVLITGRSAQLVAFEVSEVAELLYVYKIIT
jgi:transcription antitermination factor NusG